MIKCNNVLCKQIKYNGNDVKYLNLNGTIVWAKPYTLTISRGEGSSINVKRVSSLDPSASIGYTSSGATIFHGDKLEVSASAMAQYELNPYTSKYTVSGNLIIQITAKQVLFDVVIRAMYGGTILDTTIKYNVPLGTAISSSQTYGLLYKKGDYVYINPNYTNENITAAGMILTTTYQQRMNSNTIAPVLSYQYIDEDTSYEKYYFDLHILDPGKLGGRIYIYEDSNPTCSEYTMQYKQRYIGILDPYNFDFTYGIETTYDNPDIYVHVRIDRGTSYTEISTINIRA